LLFGWVLLRLVAKIEIKIIALFSLLLSTVCGFLRRLRLAAHTTTCLNISGELIKAVIEASSKIISIILDIFVDLVAS